MPYRSRPTFLFLSLLLRFPESADDNVPGLNSFVTRPDIKAPKWNITVYDSSALDPGYWFVGPYKTATPPPEVPDGINNGFGGSTIYTSDGELIWAGSNTRVEDFRLSRVDLGDGQGVQDMMTVMDIGASKAVIVDQHYTERRREKASGPQGGIFNSHELHFVEEGTKALVVYTSLSKATVRYRATGSPSMMSRLGESRLCGRLARTGLARAILR